MGRNVIHIGTATAIETIHKRLEFVKIPVSGLTTIVWDDRHRLDWLKKNERSGYRKDKVK
jgi:hypothetical protein